MENQAQATGQMASDVETSQVNLEQRAHLETLALHLLQEGLSADEVKEALQRFIMSKKWRSRMNDPFWITHTAEAKLRKIENAKWEAGKPAEEPDELLVVELADVTPEPVRWLWGGKIPLGKVTVIYGPALIGKTRLGLDLAARVSAGTNWPQETTGPEAGKVLMVNGVDPLANSISPRLHGSGAHLPNVAAIATVKTAAKTAGGTETRRLDLGRDVPQLRKKMEQMGQVRLVVIDSLEACCGKGAVSRARLRSIMEDLEQLAAECGVAVVVISEGTKCDLPVKYAWCVDNDVLDSNLRCWVPVRSSDIPLPAQMAFRITEKGIAWVAAEDVPPADRLQGTTPKQEKSRQVKEQVEWLKRELLDGPVPAKQIFAMGNVAGWSASQLKRAKQMLRLMCYKERKERGKWVWELPMKPTWPVIGGVHYLGAVAGEQSDAEVLERLRKQLNLKGEG